MGNIIGEGFAPEIIQQINVRQTIYGSVNRTNEELSYLEARTGWCKLASSVNVESIVRNIPAYGSSLATEFVLWNGVTNERNAFGQGFFQRGGVWDGQDYINVGTNPVYLNQPYNYYAYGVGGTEFGLKPMPGVKSASIKTETRGSLKTATIQIQANNRAQFDIIDALYLRLGYTMLLEWGHSSYYNNKGEYIEDNPYSLVDTFLNPNGGNINALQNTIVKKRLESNGNYDALIGKVVNFNWTYTKEGAYDITLTLRSVGDVIESLKTNILLPGGAITTNATSSTGENQDANQIIESFANTNEIAKEFYYAQQSLNVSPPSLNGMATLKKTIENVETVAYFKQNYENHGDEYYVRFGYFLSFLATKIIPYIDNNRDNRLIYIDTDIESNLIYIANNAVSADPRICLFKTSFESTSGETFQFIPDAEDFKIKEKKGFYGKIMNAYFSLTWILTSMDEMKDNKGRVNLYDLINKLCQGWNQSTGNFNSLEPVVDSETNTIKIMDENPLPDKDALLAKQGKSTALAFFDVYGYYFSDGTDGYKNGQYHSGFIKDLNFNTTIPPNLATMITVGSTSQGYIVGQDATALSQMNAGLVDRWKTTINQESVPSGSASSSSLEEDYEVPYESFNVYVQNLSSKNGSIVPTWDDQIINTFVENQTQFLEFAQAKQTQANPSGSASPTNGFLPFDLSLTMDGLSGMKVYQQFTIDSDFLPLNYPRSLNFLIKGITHELISNQWNTIIESIAVSRNPQGTAGGRKIKRISRPATSIPSSSGPSDPTTSSPSSSNITDLRTAIVAWANYYANFRSALAPTAGVFNNREFDQDMRSVGYSGQAWCNLFTKLVWKKAYEQVGAGNVAISNIAASKLKNFNIYNSPIGAYVPTTFDAMKSLAGGPYAFLFQNGVTLEPGDMVIYDVTAVTGHRELDHIGIVVAVDNAAGTFTSVDGNFSRRVTKYSQPINSSANGEKVMAVIKPPQ